MKYLVLLVLLASCSSPSPRPKYKNGQCIQSNTSAVLRIVRLSKFRNGPSYSYFLQNTETMRVIAEPYMQEELDLNEFKVVQCPQGEI